MENSSDNKGHQHEQRHHGMALFSADDDAMDVNLRNFLLMLWRRKFLIVSVMLIALAAMSIFLSVIQPLYTVRALVMIEGGQKPNPELRALMSGMRVDTTLILSEAEILKSRSLARKVIEKLGLMADPDINPHASLEQAVQTHNIGSLLQGEQKTPFKQDRKDAGPAFKSLSIQAENLAQMPLEVTSADMGRAVNRFLRNLEARPVSGSSVLQIEYTASSPERAALVANGIVDTYIEQRLEVKFKASQKVAQWLDRRLESLRKQVRESESAVEQYREERNLTVGARAEITAQQLSELNSQLVLAKSLRAEAQARLEQIRNYIEDPESVEATTEVLNARLIQNLKLNESTILRTLSDFSTRYGPKHPKIINAKAELRDLRTKIREETHKIAQGVENELKVAQARVQALEEGLTEIEGLRHSENKAMIRLRELEREAESNRMIFDTFLKTYKRSDDQEGLQEPQATVISYATVPNTPSYPNKPLFLSLTAAASFFLGIALSLLAEKLDNSFRTSSQLESVTGYPCFGIIPEAGKAGKGPIADYILGNPSSNVTESVRTLRMVLNLRANIEGEKPRVVTVTSSLPGEGKTTLSSWLGRLDARSGEKVILLDCDLRRPNIHNAFGIKRDKTIVDYLTGKATLDEVIHRDEKTGLHVIFSRSVPSSALDLLNSPKMEKLISALREAYDMVILDSPACLAVSDSRILATQSDETLYIVQWDNTPREVVTAGVKQFSDFGYEKLAFVLTNVNVKRHSRYGYGDAVYYYGRYKGYGEA